MAERIACAPAWLVAASSLLVAPGIGFAQSYPAKPVRLVVPFPPGGPVDAIGRLVGQKLGEGLGQQIVIDNRGGANGIIGVQLAARAPADGYTLLMASTGTHSINPLMFPKLPYDPARDFAPIGQLDTRPYILVVHPSLPVRTVADLIALAKAKPGQLTYASGGGIGSGNYLAGELFKSRAGVDILHVPYKGGGPALVDTVAGQVTIFFSPTNVIGYVTAGKVRALAVTGATRAAIAPDLPTMAEAGLPGFEFSIWDGIVAPAGTPGAIVARLNTEIARALKSPDLGAKFAALGADGKSSTPEALAALMKAEQAKWAGVLKASGARPE